MVEDKYLKHIREPDLSSERSTAPSILLMDFEAMYLARVCREAEAYEGDELAGAYADYLEDRSVNNKNVRVYAHTREAIDALVEAVNNTSIVSYNCLQISMRQKFQELLGELEA